MKTKQAVICKDHRRKVSVSSAVNVAATGSLKTLSTHWYTGAAEGVPFRDRKL